MPVVIAYIFHAIRQVLSMMFDDDMDVMSQEAKDILCHPEDSIIFKEAIISKKRPVTIVLSTGKELTLI